MNNVIENNINGAPDSERKLAGNLTCNGILVHNSDGDLLASNNLLNNNNDAIRFSNNDGGDSVIRDNVITNSKQRGIAVFDTDEANIFDNTIDTSKNGIQVDLSDETSVFFNTITNSEEVAIRFKSTGANNVIFENIIDGAGTRGILLQRQTDASVFENTITNVDGNAIEVEFGSGQNIFDNDLSEFGDRGILAKNLIDINIFDNTVDSLGSFDGNGIEADNVTNVNIFDNNVSGNIFGIPDGPRKLAGNLTCNGILVQNSDGEISVFENNVDNNNDGIRLTNNDSDNIIVQDNVVTNSKQRGIAVFDTDNAVIQDNIIETSKHGIQIDLSDNTVTQDNIIVDSEEIGIRFKSTGTNNQVIGNIVDGAGTRGILVQRQTDALVKNNIVTNVGGNAIEVEFASGQVIMGNDLSEFGDRGILAKNLTDIQIMDNEVDSLGSFDGNGIEADNVTNVSITGNDVSGNIFGIPDGPRKQAGSLTCNGILVQNSDGDIYVGDNTLDNNNDGIRITSNDSENIIVENNTTTNNKQRGIAVFDTDNAIVRSNTIETSQHGIQVDISDNVVIDGNTISDIEEIGIRFKSAGENNQIINNTIDGTGTRGILVQRNDDVLISGNTISDTGDNAIEVSDGDDITVVDNDITGNGKDSSPAVNGLYLEGINNLGASGNDISDVSGNGIHSVDTTGTHTITDNILTNIGQNGIKVENSSPATITGNEITNTCENGIDLDDADEVTIANNIISQTAENGIFVEDSESVDINDNTITMTTLDGIHVEDTDTEVNIAGNTIDLTGGDGIEVDSAQSVVISSNTVSNAGNISEDPIKGETRNGIYVHNIRGEQAEYEHVCTTEDIIESPAGLANYNVIIEDNDVTNSAQNGIAVSNTDFSDERSKIPTEEGSNIVDFSNVLIASNTVDESNSNGIALLTQQFDDFYSVVDEQIQAPSVFLTPLANNVSTDSIMSSTIINNVVTNSGDSGLEVRGPGHGRVTVAGNEFTGFDIGAHFESGSIDLTGESNSFTGGRIGLSFAPDENFIFSEKMSDSAHLCLLDDTVGETMFDGQSEAYIELDDDAFFAPGEPTLLSADDATFKNTPFGTFKISEDYPGGIPGGVIAHLEEYIYHHNDDATLGLFNFDPLLIPTPLAGIDQEDIFRDFNPVDDGLGGLDVTILDLPNVPGGPVSGVSFNNIAPAAGGDTTNPSSLNDITPAAGGNGEEPTEEELNALETAAGGAETGCWDDALNTTGNSGQPTRLGFDGTAEDLLNDEASCGSQQQLSDNI